MPLCVGALEEEAFNLVSGIERVTFFLEKFLGKSLEHAANVARVRSAALVDDFAEHQHLARTEDVGRRPVESSPIDAQPQIAFTLRGEAANRRAVERQIVPALEQEFLIVVEHVQTAFKIAEEHGDSLNPLLVSQVFEPLFL